MKIKNKKLCKIILSVIFAVYCLALVYVLFCRSGHRQLSYIEHLKASYNIVPFKSIIEYFSKLAVHRINLTTFVLNMLGNLLLFFPMGMLLPFFLRRVRGIKFIALGVCMIVIVELVQYFSTLGSLDVDDVILNSVGLALGYLAFWLLSKIIKIKD